MAAAPPFAELRLTGRPRKVGAGLPRQSDGGRRGAARGSDDGGRWCAGVVDEDGAELLEDHRQVGGCTSLRSCRTPGPGAPARRRRTRVRGSRRSSSVERKVPASCTVRLWTSRPRRRPGSAPGPPRGRRSRRVPPRRARRTAQPVAAEPAQELVLAREPAVEAGHPTPPARRPRTWARSGRAGRRREPRRGSPRVAGGLGLPSAQRCLSGGFCPAWAMEAKVALDRNGSFR